MINVKVGTVGYHHRDWVGSFYPQGASLRRQLNIYSKYFDTCELTRFSNQIPQIEFMESLSSHIKNNLKLFIHLHRRLTYSTDAPTGVCIAKEYKKALKPMIDKNQFAGFVASFPYAFRDTSLNRDYIKYIREALDVDGVSLQLDFRNKTWFEANAIEWMTVQELAMVCIDEPELNGLAPRLTTATTPNLLVRLHGRNFDNWWSGNALARHNYSYTEEELKEIVERFKPTIQNCKNAAFIFQNTWSGQGAYNAILTRKLLNEKNLDVSDYQNCVVSARVSSEFDSPQVSFDLVPKYEEYIEGNI